MRSDQRARPLEGLDTRLARPAWGSRTGTSFVELLVVMVIMTVAVGIFAATVTSNARQRSHNREMVVASEAARSIIETMRGLEFEELYARFNVDTSDDPESGDSPGPWFQVQGLQPLSSSTSGFQGMIHLPEHLRPDGGSELREDLIDSELGMPRDLTGDNLIDGADHAQDYMILPVRVRVEWRGHGGERSFELVTLMTEFS